jgi:hypothetical protein
MCAFSWNNNCIIYRFYLLHNFISKTKKSSRSRVYLRRNTSEKTSALSFVSVRTYHTLFQWLNSGEISYILKKKLSTHFGLLQNLTEITPSFPWGPAKFYDLATLGVSITETDSCSEWGRRKRWTSSYGSDRLQTSSIDVSYVESKPLSLRYLDIFVFDFKSLTKNRDKFHRMC